jgi:hypothetical protein
MNLKLVPQPQQISIGKNFFHIPAHAIIGISDNTLYEIAKKTGLLFKSSSVNISYGTLADTVKLHLMPGLKADQYRLSIDENEIVIEGASPCAIFYGVQTLRQIMEQSDADQLPELKIDDWPDFQDRGVCYCIAHGCVPKLKQLKLIADTLARYKINHLQLYHKHTFVFRGHPDIGRDTSPLTAEDILELDAYCRDRYVELVPALASFGHMDPMLKYPQYHHLTEDWGIGKYIIPDQKKKKWLEVWQKARGYYAYSLSPANPAIYDFLDSLFGEFLPLFSSKRFNAGCDEVVDLGMGQSYDLCQKLGKERVYLDHIIKLNELCGKYGKKMMIWGDMIRHHPELIKEIPKDITVLDWGYEHDHDFESIKDFKDAGLSFAACPSTASSIALYPSLPKAMANIAGFAHAAYKYGAQGLLNTEWGEGGHYNFIEYSWHGLVFGAEQSWNTKAPQEDFTARFCRNFIKTDDPQFVRALSDLGEINYPNNLWRNIYFANEDKKVFPVGSLGMPVAVSVNGNAKTFDSKRLYEIHDIFVEHSKHTNEDPLKILPYWIFAADSLKHAVKKMVTVSQHINNTQEARENLVSEMKSLKKRFQALWRARNHISEINITLNAYDKAIKAIQHNKLVDDATYYYSYSPRILVSKAMPGGGKLDSLSYPEKLVPLAFRIQEFGTTKIGDGFYNIHKTAFINGTDDEVVYLRCPIQCKESMKLNVGIGYDGPVKVWINKEKVFHDPDGDNPAIPDTFVLPFDFSAGKHEILIALGSNCGNAWGVFLRFSRCNTCSKKKTKGACVAFPEFLA